MSDGTALLRAILEQPGDDTARLVYADLLQEEGELERAEFIRVQCDIARLVPGAYCVVYPDDSEPTCECDCARCQLLRRGKTLINGHEEDWLATVDWPPGVSTTWRRGFISGITLPTATFLEHAAAIFAAHPITGVVLTDLAPDARYQDRLAEWYDDRGRQRYRTPNCKCFVPTPIFDLLKPDTFFPTGQMIGQPHGRACRYARATGSAALALADLSAACVAYGRSLAGLPALAPA